MTDKARELLERAIEVLDFDRGLDADDLMEEIRAYLAEPEGNEFGVSEKDRLRLFYGFLLDCNAIGPESAGVNLARGIKAKLKREPLSEDEIDQELGGSPHYSRSFTAGVRFAEKHHNITGENNE